MSALNLKGLEKHFGKTPVLKGVDLDIQDGEFIALVGPSGCGKSTLLRLIAGLDHQDAGTISMDGAAIDHLKPNQRNLAMVFQSYALYPHLTVGENIAVPLKMRLLTAWQRLPFIGPFLPDARAIYQTIARQVHEASQTLGLEALMDRKPGHLSGGQRQRVALGRALVRHPKAFLLDEPLSNLDAKLRVQMRTEITELHQRLAATFVYVTHDQAEAMTMATRIAVMSQGHLLQVGTPEEVYHRPANVTVAEFIGSPKINLLPVYVSDGILHLAEQPTRLAFSPHTPELLVPELLGLRPEALSLVETGEGQLNGTLVHMENFGPEAHFQIVVKGMDTRLIVRGTPLEARRAQLGAMVHIALKLDEAIGFDVNGNRMEGTLSSIRQREAV